MSGQKRGWGWGPLSTGSKGFDLTTRGVLTDFFCYAIRGGGGGTVRHIRYGDAWACGARSRGGGGGGKK